jgi:Sec-independent protein translocase protein TatA
MLGFSLAELLLTLIVIILFVKPKDLPEIVHFCGRLFYRAKKLFLDTKSSLSQISKDSGLDDLKYELHRGIASEKAKIEEDLTIIVDIYGNEHQVPNLKNIRPDLSTEELEQELEKSNQQNSKKD